MLSRLRSFLFVTLFVLTTAAAYAGDNDYLRHTKAFYLCSFKKECSDCYSCGKQRYTVKIQNRVEKRIKSISYTFYSAVYNKILTKEAKIEGDVIDSRAIGLMHICVPDGQHWIISDISYADGTSEAYVLHERLENFMQEPDECDCND